jgi:hypothetical protein
MKITKVIKAISLLPLLISLLVFLVLLYQFNRYHDRLRDAEAAGSILQSANELVYLGDRYLVQQEPALRQHLAAKLAQGASLAKQAKKGSGSEAASPMRKLELDYVHIGKLFDRYDENNRSIAAGGTIRRELQAALEGNIIVKSRDIVSTAQRFSQEKEFWLTKTRERSVIEVFAALLLLSVGVPAVTFPFTWKLALYLTRLRDAVSKSSWKELEPVEAPGDLEEFSAIAGAFNNLQAALRKSFSELEEKRDELQELNDSLNTKVLERTRELSQANLLLDRMRKHADSISRNVRMEAAKHHEEERRIHRLVRHAGRILHLSSLPDILRETADAAQDILDVRLAVVGHGFFKEEVTRAKGGQGAGCSLTGSFEINRGGVYLEILRGGKPLRLTQEALEAHPAWWGLPEGHSKLRGLLGVPLRDEHDSPFAVLMATDRADGADFSEEDEELLIHLASVASTAIVLARLKRECRESK